MKYTSIILIFLLISCATVKNYQKKHTAFDIRVGVVNFSYNSMGIWLTTKQQKTIKKVILIYAHKQGQKKVLGLYEHNRWCWTVSNLRPYTRIVFKFAIILKNGRCYLLQKIFRHTFKPFRKIRRQKRNFYQTA